MLEKSGSSLEKVLKVNVFLTSMDYFDDMNRGYEKFFKDPLPVSLESAMDDLTLGY